MKSDYKRTKTSVSMLRYHFVFCPYRRRKVFDIPGVEERFKELIREVCEKEDFDLIAMECHHDHTHIFLSAPPKQSPADIVKALKSGTSWALRLEFEKLSKMRTLWTRNYFVSTAGDVSAATIERYVMTQKTRS